MRFALLLCATFLAAPAHAATPARPATTRAAAAAAALPAFPKPDPAHAFAEFKLPGPDGATLRRPTEDWATARKRMADDLVWAKWVKDQRATVDDWIARRRDRVEWVAGWWHDFVSPKDGSFLTWTPDEPGEWTLASPSDPKVQLTPKILGGWVFRFRTAHAAKIREAAILYRVTGDEKYAAWVAAQLDFYADNFEKWPPQDKGGKGTMPSRLMHQSLDEAMVMTQHLHAVRLLGDYARPERRRAWLEKLFRPQCAMLDVSLQTIHNIACWQRSAVAIVALCYDDKPLWARAVDGPFGIRNQLRQGVTGDYLWFEQSMGYNAFVARALVPLFEYAWLVGRQDELREEMHIVYNLMLAPLAIRFPDGQLPTPADSGRVRAPDTALLASVARMFPTTLGVEAAARAKSWEALIDPVAPSGVMPTVLAPVVSRSLESSRMAVLVKGGWQVYFHYGQLHPSHAQAEALNYEAYFEGTDVTHDPGTVGYGSPLHRDFYSKALAHNVPLIGGLGQQGWQPGTLLAFDASAGTVSAEQPRYQPTTAVRRTLRIDGRALVDELTVTAKAGPRIGLLLNLQGTVELPATFEADAAFPPKGFPAGFAQWKSPRTATIDGPLVLPVQIGKKAMRLTVTTTAGRCRVTHANVPDAPPRRREALYVEADGATVTFTTTLEPAIPTPAQ